MRGQLSEHTQSHDEHRGFKGSFNRAAEKTSLQSVAEGATNLWKIAATTVKATATQLQHTFLSITPLTDISEANLASLCDDLETSFDQNNSEHLQLLFDLWQVLFPSRGEQFQAHSPVWKEAGWQTESPTSELKSSGILGIKCMIYFGNKFPAQSQERLKNNAANIKTNYPYAIVAVNLTLLLADLLSLRDNK